MTPIKNFCSCKKDDGHVKVHGRRMRRHRGKEERGGKENLGILVRRKVLEYKEGRKRKRNKNKEAGNNSCPCRRRKV